MSDPAKKSFLKRLLFGPATLISTAVSGTLLLLVGSQIVYHNEPEYLFLLLGAYPIAYVATVAVRYFARGDKLAMKVLQDQAADRVRQAEANLDALDRRLTRDSDPRPEKFLRDLRALRIRLTRQDFFGGKQASPEMLSQIQELFDMSVSVIRRTADLHETSQTLTTREARDQMMLRRETMLAEVGRSVNQLGATLDRLQQIALQDDGDEVHLLTKARAELDQSIEVAKRVEERMRDLTSTPSSVALRE
jgi:hypothetical protein